MAARLTRESDRIMREIMCAHARGFNRLRRTQAEPDTRGVSGVRTAGRVFEPGYRHRGPERWAARVRESFQTSPQLLHRQ